MTIRRLAGVSWVGLILLFYYRRAWRLLMAGPAAWDVHGFFNGGWRPPWPWVADALWRTAHGVGGAVAVFAAAWLLGHVILRLLRCRPAGRLDEALFSLAAGLGGLSYLSLALAALGWYRPLPVVTLVIVLAGGGTCLALVQAASARRPRPSRDATRVKRSDVAIVGVAVAALGIALVGALAPEKEYDALWYHLWLPRLWLNQGHPVDVLAEYISLYPLSWELLYGDAMAVGGVVAAKLLHFACLPMLAAATWQLTRRLFPAVSPWLAVAVLVATPTVLWEATTAYVDLALGVYVTLGLYALLVHWHESDRDAAARWLRLAALCLSFAAAIKHLGLVVVALAGLAFIVRGAAERFAAERPRRGSHYLGEAIVLGVVAVALASPWYWRAWSASGNPFFPELFSLFGARPLGRWDAVTETGLAAFKAHFGYGRSLRSFLLLPWTVTQHASAFGGSLGPIFLIAAPWVVAAMGTGLKPSATTGRVNTGLKPRATALVLLVVGYVAVWASPLSSFQLRFLVPLVPLMSVLAAVGLTRLLAGFRARAAVALLLSGLLALNLPPFISLHEGDRQGDAGWLTHVTARRAVRGRGWTGGGGRLPAARSSDFRRLEAPRLGSVPFSCRRPGSGWRGRTLRHADEDLCRRDTRSRRLGRRRGR